MPQVALTLLWSKRTNARFKPRNTFFGLFTFLLQYSSNLLCLNELHPFILENLIYFQ